MRTAALVQWDGTRVAIDIGPDFRQQMLRARIDRLDGVLITHEHNDHVIGLDEVRPFNFAQSSDMPVYALPRVQKELMKRFAYVFEAENKYPGAPMVRLHHLDAQSEFILGSLPIRAIEVMHGRLPILGFRFGDVAYLTDMLYLPTQEKEKLKGVRRLIVSALHHSAHHAHMNLKQALAFIDDVKPEEAYLIHMSHRMGCYRDIQPELPKGVQLGFDGQVIPL